MSDSKLKRFGAAVKKQRGRISRTGLSPRYMWDASGERVRFWMLDSIYPANFSGHKLYRTIKSVNKNDGYVIHIGCGRHGQALIDLNDMGAKNLIGMDFEAPLKDIPGIEFISLDLAQPLPIKSGAVQGVVFGSYLFHYLSATEQLYLLEEIDRITGKGSYGFLGPFFPQHLENSEFSEKFPRYKNPLFGFTSAKNNKRNKWKLSRSRLPSQGVLAGWGTNSRSRKGFRLPLLSFVDMAARSFSSKAMGHATIKRDYKVHVPNEFFITFEK